MLCPIVKKSAAHCPQKIKEELVNGIIEFEEAEIEEEKIAAIEEKKRLEAMPVGMMMSNMSFTAEFRDNFKRIISGQGQFRSFGKYYKTIAEFQAELKK